ncbi:hypothetical protein [Promicromonospora iranensis]|uniref:DUF2946 family protein n=1 Tax=Promicromonospora iranensis TaxID=1105144 RepID=A0ABU2CHG9_9MICO|nr:hypothetical protein [Promicromonospora iranensis]MDR7380783.1 hypothetical protein [Promicromonospora iranensis]
MRLMILFRSLLAARRRGPARVLVIMMLAVGVMFVHATSGGSDVHSTPVVAVADHHLTADPSSTHTHVGAAPHDHPREAGCSDGGCGDHHDAAALCLLALVVLLALTTPNRSVAMRLVPVWALVARWALPTTTAGTAPSLHALGISRT